MSVAANPSLEDPELRDLVGRVARYWWVELIIGAFWIVIALVILKFNHASQIGTHDVLSCALRLNVVFYRSSCTPAERQECVSFLHRYWRFAIHDLWISLRF